MSYTQASPGRPGMFFLHSGAARWGAVVVGVVALVLAPSAVLAKNQRPHSSAARKASRGLANLTVGFLAIPGEIVKETEKSGPVVGFTLGFAQGLGSLVVRELVGVYELLTAPFDIPAGSKPLIRPEFPWQYFEGK